MRMGQGVRTGLGHGGIICVLQTQFSSFIFFYSRIFNYSLGNLALYCVVVMFSSELKWIIFDGLKSQTTSSCAVTAQLEVV